MTYRLNRAMQIAYPQGLANLAAPLPEGLEELIASGFVDTGQCICLKALAERAHAEPDDFPDCTGYECFVNLVHVDDYASTNMTAIGITFLSEISRLLRERFPERSFRGIITIDEATCTVRFHAVRLGEQWLGDDLDKYEERVGVIDI